MDKINEILKGIDKDQCSSDDGWWETSSGAEFGANKLKEVQDLVKKLNKHKMSKFLELQIRLLEEERVKLREEIINLKADKKALKKQLTLTDVVKSDSEQLDADFGVIVGKEAHFYKDGKIIKKEALKFSNSEDLKDKTGYNNIDDTDPNWENYIKS